MNLELEIFLENQTEMLGNLTITDSIDVETLTDICEEYHQTKLKLLGIADVSDCYSELQMKDCFKAGVYYERSIVNYKEAKKQKGARIVMGNDTPNFSEFMHRLNNR